MQLVSKKNFVILLATILVIGFAFMSMYLNNKKIKQSKIIQNQETLQKPMSKSNDPEDIESDLNETDPEVLDKELEGLEDELNKF